MGWYDHIIVSPAKRWMILVGYWAGCCAILYPGGYLPLVAEAPLLPMQALKCEVSSMLFSEPVDDTPPKKKKKFAPPPPEPCPKLCLDFWRMFSAFVAWAFVSIWESGAYSFKRKFEPLAVFTYAWGQCLDTAVWIALFDFGRLLVSSTLGDYPITGYVIGIHFQGAWVVLHRKTFEFWYLPEHHPLQNEKLFKKYLVPTAIFYSFLQLGMYQANPDNFLWFLWVRMICDLYCAYRLRLPAPWSFDNSKKEAERHAWDWYAEGTGPRVYGYGPPLGPP